MRYRGRLVRPDIAAAIRDPAKVLYGVTDRHQSYRFSDAILTKVIYVCIEKRDGTQVRAFFYRPEDWKGRRHVEVPDGQLPQQ